MVPNASPLVNRNDSYSESLIKRINNKILVLKNLDIVPANITYQNKKKYCQKYTRLLEYEKEEIKKQNEEKEFICFDLKFNDDDKYNIFNFNYIYFIFQIKNKFFNNYILFFILNIT